MDDSWCDVWHGAGLRFCPWWCRHKSEKLAAEIQRREGWKLVIVKRSECIFKITGLTWIVERTFAWLGRSRRIAKDYERQVQTSETMIDIATVRMMINKLAPN